MRKQIIWIGICILTISAALLVAGLFSWSVTVMAENYPMEREHRIVIDAGHGVPDGGATSCTGKLESELNLEIALRLEQLLNFMGFETVMTRKTDSSVFTEGNTIAAKKRSDLKERLRITNHTEDAFFLSIHQNHFPDSRYYGAVVLYANQEESKAFAEALQKSFITTLNPGSNRQCKPAKGIFLMEHIQTPGVLIECGFLSNTAEEALLRSDGYQKKLCCVIGATLSSFLSQMEIS